MKFVRTVLNANKEFVTSFDINPFTRTDTKIEKRQAIPYHPFCRPELQALYSQSHCFPQMLPHPFLSPFHVQPHMHASAASYWINCLNLTSTCSSFIDHQMRIHCIFLGYSLSICCFLVIHL